MKAEATAFGQAYLNVYKKAKYTSGESVKVLNLNLAGRDSPSITLRKNVSIQSAELIYPTIIPGGQKIMITGGLAEVGEYVIMPQGTNLLLEIINKAGTNTTIAVTFEWVEVPSNALFNTKHTEISRFT